MSGESIEQRPLWRLDRMHCCTSAPHEPHRWNDLDEEVCCWGEPARNPQTGYLASNIYEIGDAARQIAAAERAVRRLPYRDRAHQAAALRAILLIHAEHLVSETPP